jgi:hypothetical protein
MIESRDLRGQFYTAVVIALLLVTSQLNGSAAAALGVILFLVGLVLFPKMRRAGILSAVIAAGIALLAALLRLAGGA